MIYIMQNFVKKDELMEVWIKYLEDYHGKWDK